MMTLEQLKVIVLTIFGHAATGFLTAFFVEVVNIMSKGQTDWGLIMQGALIGGFLGLFRTMVTELEKLQTRADISGVGKVPQPVVKKTFSNYFGF